MTDRRQRLAAARLYLVCDARSDEFLDTALRGGVDVVQLRCKHAPDDEIVATGRRYRALCAEHDALFILNDRPDLVHRVDADGVHLGQDDGSTAQARTILGADGLIGLSTHTSAQVDAVGQEVDYIGVGPVHATPTKPGRRAVGLALVQYAAEQARLPFFAIGGIDAGNAAAVRAAGAGRIAVVRALTEAAHPGHAARELRAAITAPLSEAHVGAA